MQEYKSVREAVMICDTLQG